MDEALYESAFAEDATFELNGQVYEGREAIGEIIVGVRTNREARLAASAAEGSAPPNTLSHVMLNSRIGFVDADTAIHRSYYQTLSQAPDGSVRIGAIGRYEDLLEKRDGEWLIVKRLLVPNSPAEPAPP
jgi:3-phenylpropionate/cinnamic acid dioxygenase small subunit